MGGDTVIEVIVKPEDVWAYFQMHKKELAEVYNVIAEDGDGTIVYITEESGYPYFLVEVNGITEYEDAGISADDAQKTYEHILELYVAEDDEESELSDEDEDRINQLQDITYDFLGVFLETDPEEYGIDFEEIDSFIDDFEEFFYDRYGIPIRRPRIVTREDGTAYVEQYKFGEPEPDMGEGQ